jgi:hypothetical protein
MPTRAQPGHQPREAREAREEAREHPGLFARVAERIHGHVAHPRFLAFCVLLIVLWAASSPPFEDSLTWEASIHTAASVITLIVDHKLLEEVERLREAVGLEDRATGTAEAGP